MEPIVLGIYLWFKIYFLIDTNTKMWTEITDLVIFRKKLLKFLQGEYGISVPCITVAFNRFAGDPLVSEVILTRDFPNIDHSGNDSRITLEQNKFSKKVTPNRDSTCDPRTVVLTSRVYSFMPSQLFRKRFSILMMVRGAILISMLNECHQLVHS